jgi:hypothetical protein
MTTEQKSQIKADLHSGASRIASSANKKAAASTGWRKWLYALIAIAAGAVAFFTSTSCTPAQVKTAATVHELYHVLSGTDCSLPVEPSKK